MEYTSRTPRRLKIKDTDFSSYSMQQFYFIYDNNVPKVGGLRKDIVDGAGAESRSRLRFSIPHFSTGK